MSTTIVTPAQAVTGLSAADLKALQDVTATITAARINPTALPADAWACVNAVC